MSRRIGGGERAGEVGEYRRHGNRDNRRDVEREQARAQRGAQAVAVDNNVPGGNDEDDLRGKRGEGGALQSPAAGEDEDGVKDGLRHGRAQADQHRQARAAEGKEGRGAAVTQRQQRQTDEVDGEVVGGMMQAGAARAEGGKDGFARKPGEGGEQGQQEEAEGGGVPGIARRAVAIATADGTGDQHGGGNAKRDGDGADEIKRGGGKADGGDEMGIVQMADKEDIDEIDDEGGEDADAARQRHVDEVAPEVAGDEGGGRGSGGAVHEWCGLGKGADFSGFCAICNKTRPFLLFPAARRTAIKV